MFDATHEVTTLAVEQLHPETHQSEATVSRKFHPESLVGMQNGHLPAEVNERSEGTHRSPNGSPKAGSNRAFCPYSLGVIGIAHGTAPLAIRNQSALTGAALERFQTLSVEKGLTGLVVLSTCNRTEIYAAAAHLKQAGEVWQEAVELVADSFRLYAQIKSGREAVKHLVRVVSGLESVLVGESEIVGQVRESLKRAQAMQAHLGVAGDGFQMALEAGRKVRATGIEAGTASISSLAIAAAKRRAGSLAERSVVILGAGQIAEGLIKLLHQARCRRVTVISRTLDRAQLVADRYGYQCDALSRFDEAALEADIVFGAATLDLPRHLPNEKSDNSHLVIDLGAPSNFGNNPSFGNRLSLDEIVEEFLPQLKQTEQKIQAADQLVEAETDRIMGKLARRSASQTVSALIAHGESIKLSNLEWAKSKLGHLSPEDFHWVEELAKRLTIGLLEHPIQGLTGEFHTQEGQKLAAKLLGLESDSTQENGKHSDSPTQGASHCLHGKVTLED